MQDKIKDLIDYYKAQVKENQKKAAEWDRKKRYNGISQHYRAHATIFHGVIRKLEALD